MSFRITSPHPEGVYSNWKTPIHDNCSRPSSKRELPLMPEGSYICIEDPNYTFTNDEKIEALKLLANKDPNSSYIQISNQKKFYIVIVKVDDIETLKKFEDFPKLYAIKWVFERIFHLLNNCELNTDHITLLSNLRQQFLYTNRVNESALKEKEKEESKETLKNTRTFYADQIQEKCLVFRQLLPPSSEEFAYSEEQEKPSELSRIQDIWMKERRTDEENPL